MDRFFKITLLFLLFFNCNHGISQEQPRIYLRNGKILQYDNISLWSFSVKCKKKGVRKSVEYKAKEIYLFEEADDLKRLNSVHASISYSKKKKQFSFVEKYQLTYPILTDSLIISVRLSSSGSFYQVYDLTDSNSKPLSSEDLIFKKKKNEKFKALLLKHFSSCKAANEIINKYEGDEWIVGQSKIGWYEVLVELQNTCPRELFWNSDKILKQIKKLEKWG